MCFQNRAKGQGVLSGDLQVNQNFYFLDSNVLTLPIPPQYYQQLSSTEAWLNTTYRKDDWTVGVRFDLLNNSGLRNPYQAINGQGLGFWYIKRKIDNLEVTAGYFYDQFGSGTTFRAYEGRGQNLDYAIMGLHAKYYINKNWTVKGFTGKQKFLFNTYRPVIKGLCVDGLVEIKSIRLQPGASIVNRTLDNQTMDQIVSSLNAYAIKGRFVPKYNTFAASIFNTLEWKNFSLYTEYAHKTREAIVDPNDSIINKGGSVFFGSLSYSQKRFGATVQYKRTDHFEFRTSPIEKINDGLITYIPPITRMNVWRLTSRYSPAIQFIGEQGFQADVFWTLDKAKKVSLNMNYSHVNTLNGDTLYREMNIEAKIKFNKKSYISVGLQRQIYNQRIYEFKPGKPLVKAWTPFAEATYKINKKKSVRAELSHMQTQQDFGSWWWGLLEYNIAPKYSFSLMDMWNYGNHDPKKRIHYYTAFAAANFGRNRFTLGYVRQVQGVICTGGVCRVEPSFNGIRATLNSTF